MPQQLFHRYKIGASPRQPRRERMPEGMPGNVIESRLAAGLLETKPTQVFPLAIVSGLQKNLLPFADTMPASHHARRFVVQRHICHLLSFSHQR